MLTRIIRLWIAVLAIGLAAPAVAVPISGDLDMFGRLVDSSNLATATSLTFSRAWTDGGTGTYAPLAGDFHEVIYTPFTFSPSLSGPVDPLWRLSYGGIDYSFVMDSVMVQSQSASALELFGTGTLYATGYDPTPGVWYFSAFRTMSGRFKFTSESASVPEPGPLLLLGLGLAGLGISRRRSKAA